jgi:hypothetical protein
MTETRQQSRSSEQDIGEITADRAGTSASGEAARASPIAMVNRVRAIRKNFDGTRFESERIFV